MKKSSTLHHVAAPVRIAASPGTLGGDVAVESGDRAKAVGIPQEVSGPGVSHDR